MKSKFWLPDPVEHDFQAAIDYLELLFSPSTAKKIVDQLRSTKTSNKKAKDILRASRLPLLPKKNVHVQEDLQKVKSGKRLSPVLLVRNQPLIIADGYHRLCSIYYLSEDIEIPCRLADRE